MIILLFLGFCIGFVVGWKKAHKFKSAEDGVAWLMKKVLILFINILAWIQGKIRSINDPR